MNLPIDAIEECIEDVTAELVGYYNSDCEELQRKGTEQLNALVEQNGNLWDYASTLGAYADTLTSGTLEEIELACHAALMAKRKLL